MFKRIIVIIVLLMILICLKILNQQIAKKNTKDKNTSSNIIKYPFTLKIIMTSLIIGWIIILVLVLLFTKDDRIGKIILSCLVLIICIPCLIYLIYICNFKIILKENCFVYKKVEYNYEFLQFLFIANKTIIYKNGNKIVTISHYTENQLLLSDKIFEVNKNNNYLIILPENKKKYYYNK